MNRRNVIGLLSLLGLAAAATALAPIGAPSAKTGAGGCCGSGCCCCDDECAPGACDEAACAPAAAPADCGTGGCGGGGCCEAKASA